MAQWPSASSYPGTPKAYPATPKAYPSDETNSYPLAAGGDVTAPTLVSAVIGAAGTTLTLTYDEALDESSEPAVGDFSLSALLSTVTAVNVAGMTVVLTLAPAVADDETGIELDYTPGSNPIQDLAGNDAATLSAEPVTNNSAHAFAPTDISGLVAWFDMQDATSYTVNGGGTGITQIANKVSAQVYDTPADDTPYEATGLNGHPCLHPNASTADRLFADEAAVASLFANTPTAITLARYLSFGSADAGLRYDFAAANSASNNGSHAFGQSSTSTGRYIYRAVDDSGVSSATESASAIPSTSGHTSIWTLAAGSINHYADNAAADPAAASNAPNPVTSVRIGLFSKVDSTPDSPAACRWGELCAYSKVLSSVERTRLHGYLAAKWA